MSGAVLFATAALVFPTLDDTPGSVEALCRHRGHWAVERSIRDGQDGPEEALRSIVRVVEGDRIVWKREGKPFAATRFEIDPEAAPKAIDLIPEGGPNRGKRVLGIYKFEGDRLIICTGDAGRDRPTAFSAEPGSRTTLMTFRRVAQEQPARPENR